MRSPHRIRAQPTQWHQALNQVFGVDLTHVPTLGIDTVLVLASEIGPDLSRFPSARHFGSWLGLAPPARISGGQTLVGSQPKVFNRAGPALRQAAFHARRSQTFIGAAHRARLARRDTAKAVKATAHQLACLIYVLLIQGQEYVERGLEEFEARLQDRLLCSIPRKAKYLSLNPISKQHVTICLMRAVPNADRSAFSLGATSR